MTHNSEIYYEQKLSELHQGGVTVFTLIEMLPGGQKKTLEEIDEEVESVSSSPESDSRSSEQIYGGSNYYEEDKTNHSNYIGS